MKTEPVSMPEGTRPRAIIEMFQDSNGNWYANVETISDGGSSFRSTATFTLAAEALDATTWFFGQMGSHEDS